MSLKECPFCGSTDVEVLEILVRAWSGKCLKCETLGPEEDSEEFAALAWNKGTPRHHEVHKLRAALERIRDCNFIITLPDRMDAVRAIAREALE